MFRLRVHAVPRQGRCHTTVWYTLYHGMVGAVPPQGTCRTIARYFLYHRGIHLVPLQDTAGNLAVTVISLERHVLQQL